MSDGAVELVESPDVDGSVDRSFPRNGRAEIMSLSSNSVCILLQKIAKYRRSMSTTKV